MLHDEQVRHELKTLRQEAHLTQETLADFLGCEQSAVSRMERGEQGIDAVTYLNWKAVCTSQRKQFVFHYEGRQGQHA